MIPTPWEKTKAKFAQEGAIESYYKISLGLIAVYYGVSFTVGIINLIFY